MNWICERLLEALLLVCVCVYVYVRENKLKIISSFYFCVNFIEDVQRVQNNTNIFEVSAIETYQACELW